MKVEISFGSLEFLAEGNEKEVMELYQDFKENLKVVANAAADTKEILRVHGESTKGVAESLRKTLECSKEMMGIAKMAMNQMDECEEVLEKKLKK